MVGKECSAGNGFFDVSKCMLSRIVPGYRGSRCFDARENGVERLQYIGAARNEATIRVGEAKKFTQLPGGGWLRKLTNDVYTSR